VTIASGLRWVAVSQGVRVGSQIFSLVVLSRLLPPHAYGLIGMAMTVTNLAFMFRDLGTMITIVQRPHLTASLTNTLFWINAGLAVAIFFAMLLSAAPLAGAYREPALAAIVCALATCIPISSLGAVQQALMERQSAFRRLAGIEGISAVAGVVTAVVLAFNNHGAWSLVGQMLVATAVAAALSCRASDWRPQWRFDLTELRDISGFTTHYAAFQFASYLQKNADAAVIGYAIGSVALGLYAMASKILLFPLQNISGIATRVLIPALSRRQHNLVEVSALYLRANTAIVLLLSPVLTLLFYLRYPIVDVVLGPRWHAAADLFVWLVPAGFVQAVHAPAQATLVALGKAGPLFKLSLFNTVSQIACIAIGSQWGLNGAACGLLVASIIVFAPTLMIACQSLNINFHAFFNGYARPVLATLAMLLVLQIVDASGVPRASGTYGYCTLQIMAAAGSYLFVLLVLLRVGASDLRSLFRP